MAYPTTKEQIERRVLNNLGITKEEFDTWDTREWSVDKGVIDKMKSLIDNADKIRLYGDYDCDGICSSVIASKGIKAIFDKDIEVTLPRRFTDGYGLKEESIERMHEEDKEDLENGKDILLMTVDNGINSYDAVKKAKEYGYKVLVTDHHELIGKLPPSDLSINPKVESINPFESPYYCGAGVIWKLLCKMTDDNDLKANLKQYAALATVADVMPLIKDNHQIVRDVLLEQRHDYIERPLFLLMKAKGIKDFKYLNEKDYGFTLAPMVNAMPRLHDDGAMFVYRYLMNPTEDAAKIIVENNELRKQIVDEETKTAESLITDKICNERKPIIFYIPNLHEGIVGIIAGRITEETGLPSIILTDDPKDKKMIKGSARSVSGFSIVDYLDDINDEDHDIMPSFGGHQGAAGLSVRKDKLMDMLDINSRHEPLQESSTQHEDTLPQPIYVPLNKVPEAYDAIESFAPYGEGNPEVNVTMVFNKRSTKMVGKNKDILMANKSIKDSPDSLKVMCFDTKEPSFKDVWVEGYFERSDFAGKDTIMLKGFSVTDKMRKVRDIEPFDIEDDYDLTDYEEVPDKYLD